MGNRDCVAILQRAKGLIFAGSETHVCCAASKAATLLGMPYWGVDAQRIRKHIMNLLGKDDMNSAYTVEGWLFDNGVVFGDNHTERMREYRLDWIDHLIKDFE